MSQGSLIPKIRFLGQNLWSIALSPHTLTQTHESEYRGHLFRVSGIFPSTYHQGSVQQHICYYLPVIVFNYYFTCNAHASYLSVWESNQLNIFQINFPEEYDEYDAEFDRMREATLKTRQVQAKEEMVEAQKRLEACRTELAYARDQVWSKHFVSHLCCKFIYHSSDSHFQIIWIYRSFLTCKLSWFTFQSYLMLYSITSLL